ncbi:4-hydroxy-4-methyl-2-oxoglutarate aldolase [Arthrobacter sp. JUb119]|uniref:RraA family protein n=1 Tax=Arthrobacter sp. JUb115 TaxID=2485108 RepID=UPI00105C4664|nr:RraA family protein [Arthrobacter sp. JUb115]MCS3494386.1 4-hydroxy-4-methyl-2-oxoglutarate aldolase [Arthrobacter sp. JUb119]TDU22480.1 4-hydroxy-4-methyl-2-oxoglutarate aldolase [Arthrobacter sp. JUb115]
MDDRNVRKIVRGFNRPESDLLAEFSKLYTGIIADAMGKLGIMQTSMAPIAPGMKLCGPATTAMGPDLTVRRMAIDLAQEGDVLVVAAGGIRDYASFGDGTARRMMTKAMSGAVIDGCVRDAAGLRKIGFPTFCLGTTPKNYHYPSYGDVGAVNVPVICSGVLVNPGDIVVGDDDGIVVVPLENAKQVLDTAKANFISETALRDSWSYYPPFDVEAELLERGYSFE